MPDENRLSTQQQLQNMANAADAKSGQVTRNFQKQKARQERILARQDTQDARITTLETLVTQLLEEITAFGADTEENES